jgi:hypothetical protein
MRRWVRPRDSIALTDCLIGMASDVGAAPSWRSTPCFDQSPIGHLKLLTILTDRWPSAPVC